METKLTEKNRYKFFTDLGVEMTKLTADVRNEFLNYSCDMMTPKPKFNIGDRVFHVTKGSDEGVVINANWYLRHRYWIYQVAFEAGREYDLYEDELSKTKIF